MKNTAPSIATIFIARVAEHAIPRQRISRQRQTKGDMNGIAARIATPDRNDEYMEEVLWRGATRLNR
jgi:hypothetical protein